MKEGRRETAAASHWPWWATICFAAACYGLLRYGSDWLLVQGVIDPQPAAMLQKLSPLVTMALLLLGAKQLYDHVPPADAKKEQNAAQTPTEKSHD